MRKAGIDESAFDVLGNMMNIKPELFYFNLPDSLIDMTRIMKQFKQFKDDFPTFWSYKIITAERDKNISDDILRNYKWNCRFIWNYSLTSLAEYFHSLDKDESETKFFWGNVENAFSLKKGSLRHLTDNNAGTPSKDYERILDLLDRELHAEFDKLLYIENLINDFNKWLEEPAGENANNEAKNKLSKLFSDIKNTL